jgi:NAD(P)-dependent dehydrogenase (short-subunit alcohol dehydrogenase family)
MSQNKTAIVTGGSRGLGRGVVEALASKGMRVLALARHMDALTKLTQEVPGAVAIAGDAADDRLAEELMRDESPDLVVLCAGAKPPQLPIHEQTWEGFCTNWNTDTKSTFIWLRHALRLPMKRGGHVVVVSSGAAVQGSPVSGGYAPAKRAQWFVADYAATESERAALGLRFHCVLPSLNPSTELGRSAIAAYAARAGVTPEEFAKRFGAPLTPAIMGAGIADLFEQPAKWPQLAYRITGAGLAPLG